jgi:hypothetical protein
LFIHALGKFAHLVTSITVRQPGMA